MRLARFAICAAAFASPAAVHAQAHHGGAVPRPFPGPSANVPAPLGTRVPVIYDRNFRRGYGYGYGYGGIEFGVGIGIGPDGALGDPVPFVGPVVPGFWWQNYNGFYGGSGFSMYGPPVPTYGPVIGMFGGSDQRFNGNNPGPFYPTPVTSGEVKIRDVTPAPIAVPNLGPPSIATVPLPSIPATPLGAPLFQQSEPPALPARAKFQMDITVPVNAQVFFDGAPTQQVGAVRSYVSTEKNLGDPIEYRVRVDWVERGTPMSKTRKVAGKAGERISFDFTRE